MNHPLRVVLLDLLVERAEFGYGGNVEILKPLAERFSTVEVWLLTPQYQSPDVGRRALAQAHAHPISIEEEDVPAWDYDFPFETQPDASELKGLYQGGGGDVTFERVALPTTDALGMESWLAANSVDVVICSGSRRNVSMWEDWMSPASALLQAATILPLPTLGICFGHQLLCTALGGAVTPEPHRTDVVSPLTLSDAGVADPLFADLPTPVALFTHQDHVVSIPDGLVTLGSSPHNHYTAVRASGVDGALLPVWGVQFHPEAAEERIARSVRLGHISEEEASAFEREHDGPKILANFAEEVVRRLSSHGGDLR